MNNNIKRAKQYIDCFNKENPNITYTCFGPTGPTGPTGPAGATITVGVTTTTDPGTNASVVNTGTPSNAVLEFNIPAGATGPQGPQGNQGPIGPAGITETSTYGRKYETSQTPLSLTASVSQDVPLATNGLANQITQETENKLTIPTTGIYKIDYYFSGSSNTATDVTISVNQNTTPISNTTIGKSLTANQDTDFVGSTIANLNANDKIGLSIEATNTATISPSSDTSAYINIIKIA